MSTGFNYITDLYDIYYVIQNTMIRYPKDTIISALKEYFSRDSRYHYVRDEFGFAKTPDHTDLKPDAGLNDDLTTRVFIGEYNRYDKIYYPAILVKSQGITQVPLSFSRDVYCVEHETVLYTDDAGNERFVRVPSKFTPQGVWEGSIQIEVQSKGIRERDDLIEIISIFMADINWGNFYKAGISIKQNLNISGPSEREDRNEKLFSQIITINMRGEWKREIPIQTIVDVISICVDIGNLSRPIPEIAPNIEINSKLDTSDILNVL
jgi:hypothetical protein